jgi:hypothetical protein
MRGRARPRRAIRTATRSWPGTEPPGLTAVGVETWRHGAGGAAGDTGKATGGATAGRRRPGRTCHPRYVGFDRIPGGVPRFRPPDFRTNGSPDPGVPSEGGE